MEDATGRESCRLLRWRTRHCRITRNNLQSQNLAHEWAENIHAIVRRGRVCVPGAVWGLLCSSEVKRLDCESFHLYCFHRYPRSCLQPNTHTSFRSTAGTKCFHHSINVTKHTWSLCVCAARPLGFIRAMKMGTFPKGLPTPPAILMPRESDGPWHQHTQTNITQQTSDLFTLSDETTRITNK